MNVASHLEAHAAANPDWVAIRFEDSTYTWAEFVDACATRALTHAGKTVRAEDVHRAFLAALDGTYGKVVTAEEITEQLRLGIATH